MMLTFVHYNARKVIQGFASFATKSQASINLKQLWNRYNRFSLNRRHIIVITGCDSGLGYSIAVRCSQRGSSVLAGVLDPDGPGAKTLAKHEGIRVLQLDLTNARNRQEFAENVTRIVQDEDLKLHAFVNNAGVMIFGLFDWLLPEHVELQQMVNIVGPQLLTRQLAPLIREHQSRVINVSSHCAESSLPGLSVYASTKSAVEGWTNSLRIEFKSYSAHAIIFVPGNFFMSSNIMAYQNEYFDQIQAGMDEKTRTFYGDYFNVYRKYLAPLAFKKKHDLLQDERLLSTFEGALLDKRPSAKYKCEPFRYTIYHTLFKIMPVVIRDWLIEKFIQIPKFRRYC